MWLAAFNINDDLSSDIIKNPLLRGSGFFCFRLVRLEDFKRKKKYFKKI